MSDQRYLTWTCSSALLRQSDQILLSMGLTMSSMQFLVSLSIEYQKTETKLQSNTHYSQYLEGTGKVEELDQIGMVLGVVVVSLEISDILANYWVQAAIKIRSVSPQSILAIEASTGVTTVDAQPIAPTVQFGTIFASLTGTHISQALIILLQPFRTLPLLLPLSPISRAIPLLSLLVGLEIDFTLAPILAVQTETVRCADRPLLVAGTIVLQTLTSSTPAKFIPLMQLLPFRLLVRLVRVQGGDVDQKGTDLCHLVEV